MARAGRARPATQPPNPKPAAMTRKSSDRRLDPSLTRFCTTAAGRATAAAVPAPRAMAVVSRSLTVRSSGVGRRPPRLGEGVGPEGIGQAQLARVEDAVRVEGRLHRHQHVERGTEGLAHEPGPVETDAAVVAERAAPLEHGPRADIPPVPVVAAPLFETHFPAEGEVQAGAVAVGVGQV